MLKPVVLRFSGPGTAQHGKPAREVLQVYGVKINFADAEGRRHYSACAKAELTFLC